MCAHTSADVLGCTQGWVLLGVEVQKGKSLHGLFPSFVGRAGSDVVKPKMGPKLERQ